MPIDQRKAESVLEEVRSYFKGQLKSSTKGYAADLKAPAPDRLTLLGALPGQKGQHWQILPGPAQREQRNLDKAKARTAITVFRNEQFQSMAAMLLASDQRRLQRSRPGGKIRELLGNVPGECLSRRAAQSRHAMDGNDSQAR